MKSSVEKKIITTLLGLALLMVWSKATQTNSRSLLVFFGSSFGVLIFLLVYDFLSDQLRKHQLVEANFQDLYNNAPCGYHSIAPDGTFIAINDTELRWLGYSRDEVIGKLKITDLLPDGYATLFQENFPHISEQDPIKDLEIQLIRKDGTTFPVLFTSTVIRDAAGNVVATRTTIVDITERKQAEVALLQSEERLRLALDAGCMGTWDWNLLTNQITWSSRCEQLFGLPPGSFSGTYEAFEALVYPEDREAIAQTVNYALQEQQDYHHEFRIVLPNGSLRWIEKKGKFFYDEMGQVVRMLGTATDISDRIAASAALAASEKRLRTIIEAESGCIKVLAADGTIQEMNAAGLAIIEADDLQQVIGKPVASLIIPKYREAFVALIQQAAQGHPGTLEFELVGLRGKHCWLESRAVALRNEQNEPIGVLAIIRDITACKRTEAKLRQSEEQLRLALEVTNIGTWDWNILTNEVTWSSGHEQLFGLDIGTFDGTYETFEACVHPEDWESIRQGVNRAHLERQDYYQEYRVVWSNGSIHWIEGKGKFFYDESGQAVRMIGTVIEISDRKHREEQLRLLESVVVNTNDAVLITEAEPINLPGPRIIYANAAFTKMTGYSPEDLIGQTPYILQDNTTNSAALDRIQVALQTKQAIRLDLINYRKDGSEIWVDLSIVPVANEQGSYTHWVLVQRDITARKQAEAKLQESEQKFRQLAENIHEVFWMNNATTQEILYVSPAFEQIWGRSCESLYAEPQLFLESIHPDDRQRLISYFGQKFTGEMEYRVVRPDGSVRWVRDRGFPIRNESGEVYRLAGIAQDITQRKEAEAMLRQVNEELELRVAQRTAELQQANDRLQRELFERERVERALRQSEERWHLAIQGSNDGIWDLDIKNNHCFHSARWAQMLGYEEHEVSNPQDRWEMRVHPDDIERVMQAREDHLERKTPHYFAEYRMRCKDGSYKWILSRAQAVWDEAGNPVRMLGSHSDISDRKLAEEARRESEERWQLALRGSNDGIWDWNVKTNEVFFSSRWKQMRGFEEYEIGNNLNEWSKRIHPDDLESVRQAVQDHFAKKTPFCITEYRVLRKDNTYMWVCDRGQALWDEEGNVVRMTGSETDITERKQIEETLRQQACIFENLYDAVILTDLDGCIIDWNPAAERVFGYSKAEVLGKTPAILHKLEKSPILAGEILTELLNSGRWVGEINFVHKDGTQGVCETVVVPLYNEQGEVIATIGVNTDITERKQAEETLRQQACIFENIYDGIIITDLDGRIIDWNPRAEKMFGYTKAEVLGKTPRISQKAEDSDELTRKIIDEMLNTGRWTGELNFICKEETESLCETCKGGSKSICETVVVPLHNEQGCAIATIWVNRDISDRKLAEAALRRAYDDLEIRVQKRTLDLAKANEELQIENAERRRVEAELKIRAQQQAAVAELGQQALAGNQLSHLINQAVALIAQILEVEYCKVLELLPDGNSLLLQAGVGWQEGLVGQATLSVDLDSQAGYTLLSTEPIIVEDLRTEERFSGPCLLHQHGVVSGLSVIIPGQSRPYGVLGAHTTRKRQFTKDDVYFLQATANVLATAINRKQAEVDLRRAHNDLEVRVQERTRDLAKANLELQQKIIERKQAEEERAKLVAILEATPDIVATTSIDGRTLYLNSAARKIFGFGENENSTHFTISNAHPEWAYEIILNEAIPSAIRDGMWVGETAFLSHDGREIPVSQLLLAHKSSDGSIDMLSTVARDMRYQKQIAATLVESERRWRSLLENVRLVVVGLNIDGAVDYVNPYFLELVGYKVAEVVGQNWFETFLPEHQKQRVQNNFIHLLEQEFYTHNQNVILTKDGEERVIAWNNTLLKDLQGNVIGTLSIGEDITERQVIERMKDEFISVVSHELRTPLTSIHGALNLLSSGLVNTQSDKGRRVIEIAAESAERLVRLVNDILELERLESGKISLIKQTCNTDELINQAIDMMQVMANRAGITLCASLASIDLHADPDRIIQVLTNLLGNAIKFSPRDSTVWLTVERGIRNGEEGDLPHPPILFQVRDQGRGIPAEKVESIFERFHQVDASDSRKKGGTGLGLAICRSIVQQHGGRIWVESVLGEGSSFYFTLPMAIKDSNYDNQANLGN